MARDKRAVDFFLRGVNEPVALEIPLSRRDEEKLSMIRKKLQEVGLRVGSAPNDLQFIEGGTEMAIVTPVLHPDDLHALYDLIATALEATDVHPEYPYVRDLQYLPNRARKSETKPWEVAEEMIMAANASGEAKVFSKDRNDITYSALIEKMGKERHLFAGSTISDPYTTISTRLNRDTRMATSEFNYALGYACGDKKISGYQQSSNSSKRYGFLYEYEISPEQPFFGNIGIESGSDAVYEVDTIKINETPIKRFTNPCVGRWFVWIDKQDMYHMYKIPENDPQWKSWLEQIQAFMPNGSVQLGWINRLLESDKQPVSIVEGVKPGSLSEYANSKIPEIREKRVLTERTKEDFNRLFREIEKIRLDDIDGNIRKFENKIQKESFHRKSYGFVMESVALKLDEIKRQDSTIVDIFKQYQPLRDKAEKLIEQARDNPALEELVKNLQTKLNQKYETLSNCHQRILKLINDLEQHEKIGENQAIKYMLDDKDMINIGDLKKLSAEKRDMIMKTLFAERIPNFSVALMVYSAASEQERNNLFKYFYDYISVNEPKLSKLKKAIESFHGKLPDEIMELSRGKSLFVNHIKRAQKKMAFEQAQQKLKKKSYQMPQVIDMIGKGME